MLILKTMSKVAPPPPPYSVPSWTTGSDEEIIEALNKHYNDEIDDLLEYWSVGDVRVIHLNSMAAANPNSSVTMPAQDIVAVIVAKNHTNLATPINGHTKAAITVQVRECLHNITQVDDEAGCIYINGDSSPDMSFTKWSSLYMRTYLNSVVWGAFPTNFKAGIKPSKHYRHTTYDGTTSEQVTDTLFLPSYPEIYGTANYSNYVPTDPIEGTQFEYYTTSSNRVKYGNNNGQSNGTAIRWWQSSASSYYNSSLGYRWMSIIATGGANLTIGDTACALAPAFAM